MCPIFLNLGPSYETLLPQLMDFFAPTKGAGIVYMLPPSIIDNYLHFHPLLDSLLTLTESSLCLTLTNHASHFKIHEESTFEAFKAYHLISYMISTNNMHRLLVSSGVAFKTNLTSYGGLGYSAVFEDLFEKYFPGNQVLID